MKFTENQLRVMIRKVLSESRRMMMFNKQKMGPDPTPKVADGAEAVAYYVKQAVNQAFPGAIKEVDETDEEDLDENECQKCRPT
tara:strand:- start:196 stop:447 length:252 start_codon:yes stop_codon:yes gene_type:complete